MQELRRRARAYVDKGETSIEKANRQDQVMVMIGLAIFVPILVVSTVWIGGWGIFFSWVIAFAVAVGLVFGMRRMSVTVTV